MPWSAEDMPKNILIYCICGMLFVHLSTVHSCLLMRKFLFLLLFLLPVLTLSAQTVTVLAAEDGKPVSDVAVYNEARNAVLLYQPCRQGQSLGIQGRPADLFSALLIRESLIHP